MWFQVSRHGGVEMSGSFLKEWGTVSLTPPRRKPLGISIIQTFLHARNIHQSYPQTCKPSVELSTGRAARSLLGGLPALPVETRISTYKEFIPGFLATLPPSSPGGTTEPISAPSAFPCTWRRHKMGYMQRMSSASFLSSLRDLSSMTRPDPGMNSWATTGCPYGTQKARLRAI